MSAAPLIAERQVSARTSAYPARRAPTHRALARRSRIVAAAKYALPVLALVLLGCVALWPEVQRLTDSSRISFRKIAHAVSGATLTAPRYRGVDAHGRPFTVTARSATQISPERLNLDAPKADVTLGNGTWLLVQARDGVFAPHGNLLDLAGDVFVYRDDGMTLRTAALALDLRAGAGANDVPVHIEGPLGVLDAPGMTLTDKGALIRFPGPASATLNAGHAAPLADTPPARPGPPPPLVLGDAR